MFSLQGMKDAPLERIKYVKKQVLWEDDHDEILTTGRNRAGERIISSLIVTEEDEHDTNHDIEYYFYLLPSAPCFAQFAEHNLPYRALFNTSEDIYVLAQYSRTPVPVVYRVTLADIPEDYMPTLDSFLPTTKKLLI